jgi:membrane protein YqaA with SNARE-associated domain
VPLSPGIVSRIRSVVRIPMRGQHVLANWAPRTDASDVTRFRVEWNRRTALVVALVGTGGLLTLNGFVPGATERVWFAGWAIASTILVTPIPQEPVIFWAATHWHPLPVALAMTAASCVSATVDYAVLSPASSAVRELLNPGRWPGRVAARFLTAPFPTLVLVNWLPIPLSPFKLLCIAVAYPLARFQLALVLGRGPRYLLLAWLGDALHLSLPGIVLLALVLVTASQLYRRQRPLPHLET